MSTTKKYYWFKMKTDFFENMSIKLLKKQKKGDQLVLLFQKVILYSLKTDGYLYYKKLMPTFHEELALAINEKPNIIKDLITYLINFDALEMVDENTYFIKLLDDCIGSETDSARRMRNSRASHCDKNVDNCSPEIEKEIDIDIESDKKREEGSSSAFSFEKKSGKTSSLQKNKSDKNNSNNVDISRFINPDAPRNKEMEEFLKKALSAQLVYVPKKESLKDEGL